VKIDDLVTTARDAITVRRVYGEPVVRDGVTAIPAASVWVAGEVVAGTTSTAPRIAGVQEAALARF
jgi:hypothetical protein